VAPWAVPFHALPDALGAVRCTLYLYTPCRIGMSHMAEYTCCSSVAFERPDENTFAFALRLRKPSRVLRRPATSAPQPRPPFRRCDSLPQLSAKYIPPSVAVTVSTPCCLPPADIRECIARCVSEAAHSAAAAPSDGSHIILSTSSSSIAPLWEPDTESEVGVRSLHPCSQSEVLAGARKAALATRVHCRACVHNPTLQVCKVCQLKFSPFKRRHHCRQCGACVCSLCSAYDWILPHISASKPVRVCRTCYFSMVSRSRKGSDST
jgi:hypothetical protein